MAKLRFVLLPLGIVALAGTLGVLSVRAQWMMHPGSSNRAYGPFGLDSVKGFDIHLNQENKGVVLEVNSSSLGYSLGGTQSSSSLQSSQLREVTHIPNPVSYQDWPEVRSLTHATGTQEMNELLHGLPDREISKTLWSSDSTLYKLDSHGACSLNRQGAATRSCN